MLALLLAGGLVYLLLGDRVEALVLIAFACLSILITVVQEFRTERALSALRELAAPRALVIRDGQRLRIPGRQVVAGDLLVLGEGDRVPADGWLMEGDGILVDESLLTGESVPVSKQAAGADPPPPAPPGGEGLARFFAGTLVVGGSGLGHIQATGAATHMGQIGVMLAKLDAEVPGLKRQTRRLVLWFATAGLIASMAAVLLYGLLRGDWLEALLAGIALGMAMLPEEFPVVLTVFLAMGAMRMSRHRVLVRRASAIESLGSATIVCSDKTGTLTLNRMTVVAIWQPGGAVRGAEDLAADPEASKLAAIGRLASPPQPTDPMDIAFLAFASSQGLASLSEEVQRLYPLAPRQPVMAQIWSGGSCAAKGAPEVVARLCGLDPAMIEQVESAAGSMAARGLRVLALADCPLPAGPVPDTLAGLPLQFRALVGIADPLRPDVPEAVRQLRAAGVRVMMITGDYPETARAIAAQAGIAPLDTLTGDALDSLDDPALCHRLASVGVCARIQARQKLRIVAALKAGGSVVAMTGDGVNDAPALKAAHIGIAMGGRGTDVAREASAIVLLDDDFGAIATAMRLGRRIHDNLRKAMGFIVAVHVPIAGLALMPLLFGLPLLLGPLHIALLELIIDPVSALAFEAEEPEDDAMTRPPRPPNAPLVTQRELTLAVAQGGLMLMLIGSAGLATWHAGIAEPVLRSFVFVSLCAGLLVLMLVNRRMHGAVSLASATGNKAPLLVAAAVTCLAAATQLVPPISTLLRFEAIGWPGLLGVLAGVLLAIPILQQMKVRWVQAPGQ
jgi:Ca2+-transporting ATPase